MFMLFYVITDSERDECGRIIAEIAKGNESSLEYFYTKFGSRLMSVALGITHRRQDAEDVLQDSMIKLVRHSKQFKPGTNGYAWVCTIVRNTALNILRKEKLNQSSDIETCIHICADTILTYDVENSVLVEKAMRLLDKREKIIIWLKYFNDATVREISDELGIPRSTVNDIIKRAEEKMKEVFNKKEVRI